MIATPDQLELPNITSAPAAESAADRWDAPADDPFAETGEQTTNGERAEKGWRLFRAGRVHPVKDQPGVFIVFSLGRRAAFLVDTNERTCGCQDHEYRGTFCKHLWAASLALPDRVAG